MAIPERDPFSALGDANRRIILADLARGESSVQELADRMSISRPAVSRHLRLLKEAGLVSDRADGVRRIYRVDETGAVEMRRFMEDVWGEAVARFRLVVENTTPE